MTLEDLKQLRSLVDSAIEMTELGLLREMSDENVRRENELTHGVRYDIRLGDYGVKKILPLPDQPTFSGNLPGTGIWYDEHGKRLKPTLPADETFAAV